MTTAMTAIRDTALHLTMLTLMASVACGNEPAGELFSSNWSTALGTSDAAHSDGGKWNNLICAPTYRNRVLSVVSGSNAGSARRSKPAPTTCNRPTDAAWFLVRRSRSKA